MFILYKYLINILNMYKLVNHYVLGKRSSKQMLLYFYSNTICNGSDTRRQEGRRGRWGRREITCKFHLRTQRPSFASKETGYSGRLASCCLLSLPHAPTSIDMLIVFWHIIQFQLSFMFI